MMLKMLAPHKQLKVPMRDSVRGGKSPSVKCPRTHSTDIGESKNMLKTLEITLKMRVCWQDIRDILDNFHIPESLLYQ